ncbi:LuxR C-terminal-related transcriptional regulator [Zestomonas carbonaria]|uniref:Serine/threonine-protein kinase PknK n=1 Tax=Zestomonas carbonaria TaxID=2762745 RepID=A0A7U7IBV5_9GAMM|nr:LuxR C-terminal-related transcriptional regulator [Pseudomonas carbonaria]CAD5109392.1 Serine/threonine-protein kinase PknK [Pseudomonas carbonaria]
MKRANTLLIRTKLMPPRVDARSLQRERLLAQLEAGKDCRLALIIGPAGSGKTTLAAQWRQRLIASGNAVGWYNLGPDDETLWAAYLVASLETAGLAVTDEMIGLSERNDGRSLEVLLPLLVNALYEHSRPLYLFLEDLQFLAALPALGLIQKLVDLAPDNFHLVISSRQRPDLDLIAIGIKGQLMQLGFSELRLTAEEQAVLLAQQGIGELSKAQQRRLHEMTDGWAAGLQLSALSLRNGGDFERSLQGGFGGAMAADHHSLDAYLDDCIARVLTPEQIAVMVRISTCRRFNRELCAALTGDVRSSEVFDVLLEQNLFLLPIDFEGSVQWYRFHQMFAGYLGRLRSQLPPAEMNRINRTASRWFAEQGMYVEAIRHAQYAGDLSGSIELLTRVSRPLIGEAHFAQLLQLVDVLPRDAWRQEIELLLSVGWAELTCNRLDGFELTLEAVRAHPAVDNPEVAVELRLLRAMYLIKRDDTAQVLDLLAPLLEQPPQQRNFHLLMLYTLAGVALLKANHAVQARDLAHNAQRLLTQQQGARPRPFLDALCGLSFYVQGDLYQAQRNLVATLGQITRAPLLAQEAAILAKATLALTCYGLDDLDAADDYVEECLDVAEVLGTIECILYTYLARAQLQCAGGMPDAAFATLERLGEIAEDTSLDRLQAWRYAEQVRIACQCADLPPAREAMRRLRALAEPYDNQRNCAWAEIPLITGMAETALALAEGDYRRAAELGGSWAQACLDDGLLLQATVQRIRAAIAHLALEQHAEARHHAQAALRDASECGMNRVFLDEGGAGLRLLETLSMENGLSSREKAYLQRCLERAASPDSAPGETAEAGKEPAAGQGILSPREQEIVMLLARALSTKSVARELNLSPGTVKWHLKNVFSKLGAFSREDAVAKARNLGLLS